jgi:PAS domain S-box-containing protein
MAAAMSGSKKPPQVDRRQLQQIIAGLSEGVLLFDTCGNIVWANEAALAAYGVEKLPALGKDEAEFFQRFNLHYRNHHELRAEDFPMARLLKGDPFSDLVVEVTRPGDNATAKRVHSLRGLILTDADGEPESLVLVVHDVTEQYSAEDRFERTFNANPAPAVICGIADLRFVKVNQGFLDMTGYARDAVIGRSVYEIDVLEDAENREDAIARLNDWRTIPQSESLLRLPDKQRKPVIVAGQPIELGEERCMLFTFMDLEPRKQAETLLRQSEERFAKAFRLAPVPMLLTTLAGFEILDMNDACATAMGIATSDATGKSIDALQIWEEKAQRKLFEKTICESLGVRNFEARLRLAEDSTGDYLISAEVVAIAAQNCVLTVMQDISERKRSETDLVAAMEAVMKDTTWFSQTVMEKLANLRQPRTQGRQVELAALTLREREVLELICQGSSDGDIAAALGLSRNTVRNHVATLYGKIDVHRRSAAIVWARERGITGPQPKTTKRS